MNNLTDGDLGFLVRAMWANGGGARGSKASQKRLIECGFAEKKPINRQTHNETIFGERVNITKKGIDYILTGKGAQQ